MDIAICGQQTWCGLLAYPLRTVRVGSCGECMVTHPSFLHTCVCRSPRQVITVLQCLSHSHCGYHTHNGSSCGHTSRARRHLLPSPRARARGILLPSADACLLLHQRALLLLSALFYFVITQGRLRFLVCQHESISRSGLAWLTAALGLSDAKACLIQRLSGIELGAQSGACALPCWHVGHAGAPPRACPGHLPADEPSAAGR